MDSKPLGGRYQIIRQLGAGGFSRTFLVKDLHLPSNPKCIIKQLEPQTRDPRALEMARRLFDTEAKVLYQLGIHPQIPSLLAHFEDNQEFYLAQEYIEGTHLSREFVKGVSWPQARVILLMQEVLKVLSFVHNQQVIHRDIKPSNLIRRFQDNQIVLIDFGAVKRVSTSPLRDLDTGSTNLTVAIGTQGYMPNEQYAGKPRYSSDVYAVGMLGIRALTGVHPKKIAEDPTTGELAWQQFAPSTDPNLAAVIDKMVRYDFRDRYPTAAEALKALNELPEPQHCQYISGTSYPISNATAKNALEQISFLNTAGKVVEDSPTEENGNTFIYDTASTSILSHQSQSNGQLAKADSGSYPVLEVEVVPAPRRLPHISWLNSRQWLMSAVLAMVGIVVATATAVAISGQRKPQVMASLGTPKLPPVPKQVLAILSAEQMANFHVKQADQMRQSGQSLTALAGYEKAIQTKPDYAPAHLGRCLSFLDLQKSNEAIVACNDALAYDDYIPQAIRGKGNALEQQERLLEALQHYEEANRQMPAMFEAWLARGRVLHKLGRSAEAVRALDEAIARDRTSVEAWTIRGKANWTLGRFDQAIIDLDKALMLQPDNPEALEMRRKARQRLGR